LTETQETRQLLTKACTAVLKRLQAMAADAVEQERKTCEAIGIEVAGSPVADALSRKADRVSDELSHLGNATRPCWNVERVLASL